MQRIKIDKTSGVRSYERWQLMLIDHNALVDDQGHKMILLYCYRKSNIITSTLAQNSY